MNSKLRRPYVWVPLIIAVAFAGGIWMGSLFFHPSARSIGQAKLGAILQLIDSEYVDDVDGDSLIEATIPDLLAKLDPHTAYIPAEDLQSTNEELEGSFSGIGISFNTLTDTITVLEVISGGPSERVGILAGDRIITIDDSIAAGKKWSQQRIIKSLRGPKGSVVKLGVKRATSPDLITFEVTRGDIPVSSIDANYMAAPEVGYIKVNKFGRNTYMEFITAMAQLRANGANSYILDLRGNGGGFMEPAVLMANEFLKAGHHIVATHGRIPSSEGNLTSDGMGSFSEEPLVVLLDEFTASSSEIFAGAIQDNDRGLIVGRRSFGKGLVQRQIDLPDSSAIRLTTARYYTPSGRCIQKQYTPGSLTSYEQDLEERFERGESFNVDSIHIDKSKIFYTVNGRTVYGGGGIMPDIFVPNDTVGLSTYYINVSNNGLIHRYAFAYTDLNRQDLNEAENVTEMLEMLPPDDELLVSFVNFAQREGKVTPRWYYINVSRNLILSHIKALIARDVLGTSAYYEVINESDPTVLRALSAIIDGEANFPLLPEEVIVEPSDSANSIVEEQNI